MSKLIYGDRIGKTGKIIVGASAMIWDPEGEKILLTRRSDNGRWCLPGGRVDPGESVAETCAREVFEETGLSVKAGKLIGVYSDPNMLLTYEDGNKYQLIALHFDASVTNGELVLSSETTDIGFFSMDELNNLDVMEHHLQRIEDGILRQKETFVR
jgi:8-oxo-dGTP pyrophosphatase MutT (NUDIX family)